MVDLRNVITFMLFSSNVLFNGRSLGTTTEKIEYPSSAASLTTSTHSIINFFIAKLGEMVKPKLSSKGV